MAEPYPQFGVAIEGVFDVGKTFFYVSGLKNLGNRIARRLTTPAGSLFYDLTYGFDVRQFLNAGVSDEQVKAAQGEIAKQLQLDEMIQKATVKVTRNVPLQTLTIDVRVATEEGPFQFVLAITQLTVEILTSGVAA